MGFDRNQAGYALSSVNGWMYVNEHGQMCGPYIQAQLHEGLSTGFLPEELPVYPIVNGNLANPIPLKCLKQFHTQALWSASYSTNASSGNSHIASHSSVAGGTAASGSFGQAGLVHCHVASPSGLNQQTDSQRCATHSAHGYDLAHTNDATFAPSGLPMVLIFSIDRDRVIYFCFCFCFLLLNIRINCIVSLTFFCICLVW